MPKQNTVVRKLNDLAELFSRRVPLFADLGTDIYLEYFASNKNKTLRNEMKYTEYVP